MLFNTVMVKFIGKYVNDNKEYSYLTDLTLKEKDIVVVDTQYGVKTAEVVSLCGNSNAHKWVVCKIDVQAFEDKLAELKRKQFILQQMSKRLSEVSVITQYEKLAETDETMKTLLDAFNTNVAAIEGDLL